MKNLFKILPGASFALALDMNENPKYKGKSQLRVFNFSFHLLNITGGSAGLLCCCQSLTPRYWAWILHRCRRSYLDRALKISGFSSKRYSGGILSNSAAVRLISAASRHSEPHTYFHILQSRCLYTHFLWQFFPSKDILCHQQRNRQPHHFNYVISGLHCYSRKSLL